MKKILSFKLFELKEYSHKLDNAVLSRLIRGKDQGYIKDYNIDYDKMKIDVFFVDPIYATDTSFEMDIRYPEKYDNRTKQYVRGSRPIHTLTHDMHNFTNLMNITAKKFVKLNKSKGVIGVDGKMHSELELVELLKDSDAMQKLMKLDLTPKAFKNGKIEFYMNSVLKEHGDKAWPTYSISKGGKIYLLGDPPTTLQSLPPLNSVKDYENALASLFYHIYTKKMEKWKMRYEKDPSVISKIPHIYLKDIAPKLADVATKIGIFDPFED